MEMQRLEDFGSPRVEEHPLFLSIVMADDLRSLPIQAVSLIWAKFRTISPGAYSETTYVLPLCTANLP